MGKQPRTEVEEDPYFKDSEPPLSYKNKLVNEKDVSVKHYAISMAIYSCDLFDLDEWPWTLSVIRLCDKDRPKIMYPDLQSWMINKYDSLSTILISSSESMREKYLIIHMLIASIHHASSYLALCKFENIVRENCRN